ncbi:MAG TPA: hypothetical protein ENK23_05135 [Sorangium sp.]|nr:hypothetical protein [Sorangium sp.]
MTCPTPTKWLLVLAAVASAASGCAAASQPASSPHRARTAAPADEEPSREQPTQQVEPMRVAAYTAEALTQRFERARSQLLVGDYATAAKAFDHLMHLAEDPELRALSRYNSGLAYASLGQHTTAIARYRMLLQDYPRHPIAKHGLVRLTRLLGYLERWPQLEQAAAQLLRRPDLVVMDRIEGYGAQALARAEQNKLDSAKVSLSKATALIDKHRFGRSGAPPVQLAQVSFAEGELRRIASEAIHLTPVPDNFGAVLEARCQGLLDAQSSYTDAMRSRDAHWSAMSGYRVGQLYQQLHREAMAIPAPGAPTLKQQRLFRAAMRLRYRILLEKGLRMMAATVALGERTGQANEWTARARESKRQLEQQLQDEKAALAASGYEEEVLRAALDKLKRGAAKVP